MSQRDWGAAVRFCGGDGRHTASNSEPGMTPLLTARQVAKLLGVHVNSVKRMVRNNEIAHYRLGTRGDLRFRVEDVEAWLEGRRA